MNKTLKEISKDIYQNSVEHGWWDSPVRFGESIALIHSELSEAFEEHRKGLDCRTVYHVKGKPEGIPIELADAIIRILALCEHYNIDIERAILIKEEFNKTRPYKHGGKVL